MANSRECHCIVERWSTRIFTNKLTYVNPTPVDALTNLTVSNWSSNVLVDLPELPEFITNHNGNGKINDKKVGL